MSAAVLSNPGTLVHARGREWIVLPDSTDELLMVRPVGGLDEEITGLLPSVEPVQSAAFSFPTRNDLGDFQAGALLRDAARISTRAAAGPFRSFGRIAVDPRPYQLVPLLMALRLDPVRLLVADDVGIGKTVEACLIARELLDRGEIKRLAVLCPPHLAEQWQKELASKFHIEAELILSSTIQRLERDLPLGVSVFDRHPFVIVSTDFIKGKGRRDDFALKCPEFVIVDEAHGCTPAGGKGAGRQLRYELIQQITKSPDRHVVLVTATPHSGNEQAFRSLLGLLDGEFENLPTEIELDTREALRKKLALHLVQRRRADIRHFLDTDTSFPKRLDKEETYAFSPEYRKLFNDVIQFAREFVTTGDQQRRARRVRYWSALALLRCFSSSPAAAVATLRSRADVDEGQTVEEVNQIGRERVMDESEDDKPVVPDFTPGASPGGAEDDPNRRQLLAFARRAEELAGKSDQKLIEATKHIKGLLADGHRPIIFCRFIDTAEYVARHLRETLGKNVAVDSVTGTLPPAEREARIAILAKPENPSRVLVCTDCLSEGVNLQRDFDAVVHYDLCWNPTRHEQREGRVDRFGQKTTEVRVLTYYGRDNPIDGVILDVLLRKHKSIKSDLGVSVSVPGSSEEVAEALFEGALFREMTGAHADQLGFDFGGAAKSQKEALHQQWENARDKEKASRSRFAQHALKPELVAAEMNAVRQALGSPAEVEIFFRQAMTIARVPINPGGKGSVEVCVHEKETPRALRQALQQESKFIGRFDLPLQDGEIYLGRTSPVVEGLSGWVLDQALDPAARDAAPIAARCGLIRTKRVNARTTLIVARFRFHLKPRVSEDLTLLCEEIVPLAFTGSAQSPNWISSEQSEALLSARPDTNINASLVDQQLPLLLNGLPELQAALGQIAAQRAAAQLQAHERVREAARDRAKLRIEPVLPVDILGAYLLLPVL
jgi:superfamily II DNA or RNA helicase